MFPYLDLAGFSRRALLAQGEISFVEQDSPGFVAQQIAAWSSYINGRMRKRYGNDSISSALPFGQQAPTLVAAGTNPPAVVLQGRPTLGSMQLIIQVTTPGAIGAAIFKWSSDGGITFNSNVVTAASITLGNTGLTATFAAGTYSIDNLYMAATPVPEVVLGWLTALVTYSLMRKRGGNFSDPPLEMVKEDMSRAMAEIKEAADSKDGLWDLPTSEDQDSAVTTGFVLGYSETSPYIWTNVEVGIATQEDAVAVNTENTLGDQVLV